MFFTIIFAVFLHDLSFAYQASSKQNHSIKSYNVVSIYTTLKITPVLLILVI